MMRKGARVIATELIREPVKEAVREALREETAAVQSRSSESGGLLSRSSSASESHREQSGRGQSGRDASKQSKDQSSGGGRSKLTTMALVLAIAGITYFARRRMSSTSGAAWSEQSPGGVAEDDAEGGYVSEGEMQTAETADESVDSQSTAADQ